VFAVMTVDEDLAGKFADGLRQFQRPLFRNPVVTVRQVDVPHSVLSGGLDVRLHAVDADDRLHSERGQFRERLIVLRHPA
jgi:hypothetical protein